VRSANRTYEKLSFAAFGRKPHLQPHETRAKTASAASPTARPYVKGMKK
jgi:hypothetical protein